MIVEGSGTAETWMLSRLPDAIPMVSLSMSIAEFGLLAVTKVRPEDSILPPEYCAMPPSHPVQEMELIPLLLAPSTLLNVKFPPSVNVISIEPGPPAKTTEGVGLPEAVPCFVVKGVSGTTVKPSSR